LKSPQLASLSQESMRRVVPERTGRDIAKEMSRRLQAAADGQIFPETFYFPPGSPGAQRYHGNKI